MAISISASNLNPQVEELVEIYISRSIPENVGVWAYVNGVEKATWTVPPNGNLIIIPSMLGTTITFNAEGLDSHEKSNTLILTVQVSIPWWKIGLVVLAIIGGAVGVYAVAKSGRKKE